MVKNNAAMGKLDLFFLIFISLILLLPLIIASDNIKTFEKGNLRYGKVTITSNFGAGDILAEITLENNSDVCSTDCYAKGKIVLYTSGKLIDSLRFKKLSGTWQQTSIKSYKIQIASGLKDVDDYKETCIPKNDGNGTYSSCSYTRIGSHKETNWIPYTNNLLPAGTYEWQILGQKEWYENVDWLASFFGVEVNDWALWGAGSSNTVYYSFETPSTYVINDADGTIFNGTFQGEQTTANFVTGKVGKGLYFNGTQNFTNPHWFISNTSFSVSLWVNPLIMNTNPYFISAFAGYSLQIKATDNNLSVGTGVGTHANIIPMQNNLWQFLVVTYNGSQWQVYKNGTNIVNYTEACPKISGWISTVGADGSGGTSNDFNGTMDGIGIWNRTLTNAEITQLWNNGAGVTFEGGGDFTINLTSPVNYANLTKTSGYFAVNFSSQTHDFTNATYYIWNSTGIFNNTLYNVTGLNNLTNISFIGLKSGSYTWNVYACDNSSICNFGTNSSFIVVTPILALCNSTYTTKYINYTFKDESTLARINASIPTSTFSYYLSDDSLLNGSLSLINNSYNYDYSFCFSPSFASVVIDSYIQYSSSGYPQRTYDPTAATFTNITTNKTLYLLSSSSGIYVTFQVVNIADQPISNVAVNATRIIDSELNVVGVGTTGADGSVTFWLNPDYSHTFTFVKTGYETYTTSLIPTQSTYTVTLGSGATTTQNDYTRGIVYSISPTNTTLFNGTDYNFNFTISSSYWVISSFGFVLKNSSDYAFAGVSSTDNGGTLSYNLNTGNQTNIIMEYFYIINSSSQNSTKTWYIISDAGTEFSLFYFFTDLKNYLTAGMFGLNNFGLSILLFIFIFVFTGVMSWKYGITSPVAIAALVFSLIAFLDVGAGIMDNLNPIGAIPHFPTIFFGVIFGALLFREVYS